MHRNLNNNKKTSQIDSICRHIENKEMSFIVGAGFSMNVSDEYKKWDDLLSDMVKDMWTVRKNEKIWKVINKHGGYLAVAEEYVNRHNGFHEAIDLYIEKHIPYLKKVKGKYQLYLNGNHINKDVDVRCHQLLNELNAQNIYTFNYDNCLETVLNAEDPAAKTKIITEKGEKYSSLCTLANRYYDLSNSKEHKKGNIGEVGNTDIKDVAKDLKEITQMLKDDFDIELKPNMTDLSVNRFILMRAKDDMEGELERLKSETNDYIIVKNGYSISLTETGKSIYKLHGDLRIEDKNTLEFDNDKHKQYVISQSDYDEYPTKHEPFVNLMKVALLRGYFCIIGFSCYDPNFRLWINWVKDVLDRNPDNDKNNKIFYINVGKSDLDEEMKTILTNHFIEVVNTHELYPEAKDKRERMELFLQCINRNASLFDRIFDGVVEKISGKNVEIESAKCDIERLWYLVVYNRVTTYNNRYSSMVDNVITKLSKEIPMCELSAKLLYVVAVYEQVPVLLLGINQRLKTIMDSPEISDEIKIRYAALLLRSDVLLNNHVDDKYSNYLTKNGIDIKFDVILCELINLNFANAKKMLTSWEPKDGFDKMRRLVLISLYDAFGGEADKDTVKKSLDQSNYLCLQDYVYASDLLRTLIYSPFGFNKTIDKTIWDKIDRIIEANNSIKRWSDRGKIYQSLINGKRKMESYGDAVNISIGEPDGDSRWAALKYIYMMVELGVPTGNSRASYINADDWYNIWQSIYKEMPLASLYYLFLQSDQYKVERAARDFIYDGNMEKLWEPTFMKMLNALMSDDTPKKVKNSIFTASRQLMKVVPQKVWQNLYKKAFKKYYSLDWNFGTREKQNFLCDGLEYINDAKFKMAVIRRVFKRKNSFNLFDNSLLIAACSGIDKEIRKNVNISSLIGSFIKRTDHKDAEQYILVNMSKYADNESLIEKYSGIDDKGYENAVMLQGLSNVVWKTKDEGLHKKLLDILKTSPRCWETGISHSEGWVAMSYRILNLNDIQKSVGLDDETINVLYDKLQVSLDDIITFMEKHNSKDHVNTMSNFFVLGQLMYVFLKVNKMILQCIDNYAGTLEKVDKLLSIFTNGQSLFALLASDQDTLIERGIVLTKTIAQCKGIDEVRREYTLVTNRIVIGHNFFLESFVELLNWTLNYISVEKEFFCPLYKSVLESVVPYFRLDKQIKWQFNARKDYVEALMMNINMQMRKSWNESVKFWDEHESVYEL